MKAFAVLAAALLTVPFAGAGPAVGLVQPESRSVGSLIVGRAAQAASSSRSCTPRVRLSPSAGVRGTVISVRGRCFGAVRRDAGAHPSVFLLHAFASPRECELRVGKLSTLRINRVGALRGHFTVARRGACFQHDYTRRATPARYTLGVGCLSCLTAAEFRVTRP